MLCRLTALRASLLGGIVFTGRVERLDGSFIGSPAIYAVNLDGSGLRRLTVGAGEALHPAWSRDGSRIAFATGPERAGGVYLWVMNPDGSNARPAAAGLPECGSEYKSLTWAPAGDRLAAECSSDVRVFDLRTARSYSLSAALGGFLAEDPDWSPDGTRLAFGAVFGIDVLAASPDGARGSSTLLARAADPSWSPDGRRVAFMAFDESVDGRTYTGAGVYVANADGSGRTRVVAPGNGSDEGPVWSADGRWIAFHRYTTRCLGKGPGGTCGAPHWSVYAVRADGTGLRRLTPDSLQATRPTW